MDNYTRELGGWETILLLIPVGLFFWGTVTGHFLQIIGWIIVAAILGVILRFAFTLLRFLLS